MAQDLKSILTPSLFHHLYDSRFPYDKKAPLDLAQVFHDVFRDDTFAKTIKARAWSALKALSDLGLDNVPDLMQFLPEPADPDFPVQLLGLQLLLDQCTRALFRGVNSRYTGSYFDLLERRLADKWSALPEDLRPDSWERWDALGVSLELWVTMRIFWGTPWVHGETPELQAQGAVYTNVTRETVEKATGTRDAYRDDPTIWTDTHAFPRVYQAGPPEGEMSLPTFTYWLCMLMDIHKPIADKFGRVPTKNAMLGRENTPEEAQWLKEEKGWQEVDPEVKKRVWADIKAGTWTPLPDSPPS